MTARFNVFLQVRAPSKLIDAVDKGSDRSLIMRSDYVRLAVIDRLKADGIEPASKVAAMVAARVAASRAICVI